MFRKEKISRGWSFWSVIRTSLLSYSCFFLLQVEVEVELGVLLVTLLDEDGNDEGGKEEEVERSFFNFSI